MDVETGLSKHLKLPGSLRYSLSVVMLLLAMNFLLRLAFLCYNTAQASALPWPDLLLAFARGIRYDLSTILILNGFVFLVLSCPFRFIRHRITYNIANILILLCNIPVLVVNAVDVIYYGFSEKRLTHELFTTRADLVNFNPDVLAPYWWLFLIVFSLFYILYRVLNRFARRSLRHRDNPWEEGWRAWVLPVICLGLVLTGIRGGWQQEALHTEAAFNHCNLFAGNLSLNSGFTIMSSFPTGRAEPAHMLPAQEALRRTQDLVHCSFDGPYSDPQYPLMRQTQFAGPENRYNVVILIIESLNAEDVGIFRENPGQTPSLTPFMDSLAAAGRYYTQYYSNAIRSVESLPAVLNSQPDIFGIPTINSVYEQNRTWGIGNMLEARGWHTSFFCGGRNGTLGFDHYSRVSGFTHYYGQDDYPAGTEPETGLWGIHDKPMLQWMCAEQSRVQEPFATTFFSISNHHPFKVPDSDADLRSLPVSDLKQTVAYTDRALQTYFTQARQQPWFNRTIFVITGDHCFHESSDPGRTIPELSRVPLILYGPGVPQGRDTRLANHLNVMPTLLHLLRLDTWHASCGNSLLEPDRASFVVTNYMGVATLMQGDHAWSTNFEQLHQVHFRTGKGWITDADACSLSPSQALEMDLNLRSLYQTLNVLRVENRLAGPQHLVLPPPEREIP